MRCFFVSDLHGSRRRAVSLFARIEKERPDAVFIGGDLLPHAYVSGYKSEDIVHSDFIIGYLAVKLRELLQSMQEAYPHVFIILGNDDPRTEEDALKAMEKAGLCHYIHGRGVELDEHSVFGYSYIPPSPFQLKDWERYDVSRYVDPGCVSPEEGTRTVPVPDSETRYATIEKDLALLTEGKDLSKGVGLFHAPPYQTDLDRAALDGKMIDFAPVDVHIGSIAVKRFIEERAPLVTLHGHVHESSSLTGHWRCQVGRTHCLGAAFDGPELALIKFETHDLANATRELI